MEAASFRLSWSRFPSHVLSALDVLRQDEDFVDVSIYCAGRRIKAHRNVLSASSAYFKEIFKANPSSHPVVILCDVDYASLRALVDFMYHGEIEVPTARLDELLRLGEMLQVQGISSTQGTPPEAPAVSPTPPADPPLPLGDAIAPECVITEPSARGAAVAARKRRRRPPRRDDAADLATPAGCGMTDAHDATAGADHVTPAADHVTPAAGHVTPATGHVMPATGHVSPAAGHVMPAAGHVMPATGHVMPATGHVMPATGHVTPAAGHVMPAAEAPHPPALPPPPPPQLTPGGQPSPPTDYVTPAEAVDWSVPEPTGRLTCPVKPEPAPEPERVRFKTERAADAADSKLLLDDMLDNSGQDTSPYSGGMFVSSIALGRPMTGAERARRYRERKKLKKLYETLLGQSPRREQLAVQL